MIDKALLVGDLKFTTPRDRGLYLGSLVRDRPLWLKENPGAWQRIQNLQQEVPVQPLAESESNVGTIPARPSSHASSPAVQNNGNDDAEAGLADIPARDSSPPQKPVQTIVRRVIDASPQASPAESEMTIGSRRYVSARRLASMLGVSLRTLSRWDAAGTGPPKIKIGKKVIFDLGKISEWLESREIPSTRVTGQN